MTRIWKSICVAFFIICVTSCSSVTTEQPKENNSVIIDVSGFVHTRSGQYGKILPVSADDFIYYVNGWKDDTVEMMVRIYSFSRDGQSDCLSEKHGFHITRMAPFGDSFLLLLKEGNDDKKGLTMLCVDNLWAEKWRYVIEDGLVDVYVLDDCIFLETCPPAALTYPFTTDTQNSYIMLDGDGSEMFSRSLGEEGKLYVAYIGATHSYYEVVRNTLTWKASCKLRILDELLNVKQEIALPFLSDEENVISIVCTDGKELLLTDRNIYEIGEKEVALRASAPKELNKWLKGSTLDNYLSPVKFYRFDNGNTYYVGHVMSKATQKRLISISASQDFTQCSIRAYALQENLLCAIADDSGRITMITENESGKVNILTW